MSEECQCPLQPGDKSIMCPRHGIKKYRRQVELCQQRGKYWLAWEADGGALAATRARQKPHGGPGTELKAIIARWQRRLPWFDLSPRQGCDCANTARMMDRWGCDRCSEKIGEILDKLEAEAVKRHLTVPFRRTIARSMVKLAIRRARLKAPATI